MGEIALFVFSTFTGRSEVRLSCRTAARSREGLCGSPAGGRTPAASPHRPVLKDRLSHHNTTIKQLQEGRAEQSAHTENLMI